MRLFETSTLWGASLGILVSGCVGAPESSDSNSGHEDTTRWLVATDSDAGGAFASADGGSDVPIENDYGEDTAQGDMGHPSTGWLDTLDSPVRPWCAAVLIAPDVVLTTAECAQAGASPLQFGVGLPGSEGTPVVRTEFLSDSKLAALLLESPLSDVEPAQLAQLGGDEGDPEEGQDVEGVAMAFTERDATAARWTWKAELLPEGDDMAVRLPALTLQEFQQAQESGAPNCHGDSGAGVYTRQGELVGIVVGARSDGNAPCVDALTLGASFAAGSDAWNEALALSNPDA